MTPKSIKLIAFIILLVHGIGHFQGVVAAFGVKINNAAVVNFIIFYAIVFGQKWLDLLFED